MKAKLTDAPECLNINDKAMRVLGWNEYAFTMLEKLLVDTERTVG